MKKPKVKLIKDRTNNDDYTFLKDIDSPSTQSSTVSRLSSIEHKENSEINEVDNPDKIYKKKKVLSSKDMTKVSKGLKFTNPSQRNHSSVYE